MTRSAVAFGLRANWRQFWLLVAVNGLVGAMVGLERTVLPLLAAQQFGIASGAAVLSFIGTFGLTKAVSNLLAGTLADRVGRRRVLILGWLAAVPVPLLIIVAPSWTWIVVANLLLGVNQGLAWSATVIMKVDLAGPRNRGVAMGLNEFAGYVSVGVAAFLTGVIAERFGLRPAPFYLGIAVVAVGLGCTLALVRETVHHARAEASAAAPATVALSGRTILARVSWQDRSMMACSQAGLVNNANDGVVWGLLPILLAARGSPLPEIGALAALYPLTWGALQPLTGWLSDSWGRKWLIAGGMLLQGAGLLLLGATDGVGSALAAVELLGVGTAMVYPTLLAAISDLAAPEWRASAIGVYRFWRDLGYVFGALVGGVVADLLGIQAALIAVAALTAASGVVVARWLSSGPDQAPPRAT